MDIKTFFITTSTSVGSAILLFIGLSKYFGNKFIESQFNKSIEKYKQKINLEFDRISKINQREFEVLPIIWSKLQIHKRNLQFYTNNYFLALDMDTLTDEELSDILAKTPFSLFEKNMIIQSENKMQEYINITRTNGMFVLQQSCFDFINTYDNNRIFLPENLDLKINEISEFLKSTLTVYRFIITSNNEVINNVAKSDFDRNFEKLSSELGRLIQNRLLFQN